MNWIYTIITSNQAAEFVRAQYKLYPPDVAAFDTETNGLHIICDRPFLFQFGWYNKAHDKAYANLVDLELQPHLASLVIKWWHKVIRTCPVYLAHNVRFDLHMLENIKMPYTGTNLSDTMYYIRLSMDNIPTRSGGVNLQLKSFATKYIDPNAKNHEHLLHQEQTTIAKELNAKLVVAFNGIRPPEGKRAWTKGTLNELFNDLLYDISDIPHDLRHAYRVWASQLPEGVRQNMTELLVQSSDIPYNMLSRDNMYIYALKDIEYTILTYLKCEPVLRTRMNEEALAIENKCILPFYDMERTGFKVDGMYLNYCKENLKRYIEECRAEMIELAGEHVTVGQHARIKIILADKYGIHLETTDAEYVETLLGTLDETYPGARLLKVIQELRTLQKWYATYLMRFIKDLRKSNDRLYTQINQVGAASGRVTSDFQQFPKDSIKDSAGNELFNPRQMVLSEHNGIVYLDYSQIELRLQALYTILVGDPDLNLCRAYMPYQCVRSDGAIFDYNIVEHIKHYSKYKWYYIEQPGVEWTPTDVHGATTKTAFNIDETHPEYKHLRYLGKRANFAKNYGATRKRIRAMFPHLDEATITLIDDAYYKTFPGVRSYHSYCYRAAVEKSYVANLLGVKYYGVSGHNLINMLIQGSGAYFLKLKIIEVYNYLKDNGCQSKFQMNIHDELSFDWIEDSFEIFYDIKRIMETWDGCLVPIIADMELTTTNWSEKKEVN